MDPRPALRCDDLRKSFGEGAGARTVLDGISGSVATGERLALMGRSGSGKTTLLHCIGGIETVDSGSITIAGSEVTGLADRERASLRRSQVSYIFQNLNLLPTLSVMENVLLRSSLSGRVPVAVTQRAEGLLERVGLGGRGQQMPERLSGGERQRVAIVAACVHQPDIILADEPTGSLDSTTGEAVLAVLDDLQAETGCTVLMATHDPAVAERCDRRWQLADGRLVAES